MSARHRPVSWTPAKRLYDAALLLGILGYLLAFLHLAPRFSGQELDGQSLAMRAYGSCAFLLLSAALAIGPLARLAPAALPLLYNRRHLGVLTFLVALAHALEVLGWYFAYSPVPPLVALLSSEPAPGLALGLPFLPPGILALLILFALAATSHDFFLSFLTPAAWKALHMAIYPAYALVVAHIAFGALQDASSPGLTALLLACAALVAGLHLAAALRQRGVERAQRALGAAPWLRVGPADAVPEGAGLVVHPPEGEAVAIFRHQGRLSAVTNLCAHQNGPLGEGRVVDGCITCPWHGFQYRLEDGCAPPPYTEKLATYRLALEGATLLLDPRPNPPGTRVEPLALPGPVATAAEAGGFFIGWSGTLPPALRRLAGGALAATLLGLPGLGLLMGLAAGDPAGPAFATVPGSPPRLDLPEPAALRGLVIDGPYPLLHLPASGPAGRGRTLLLASEGKLGASEEVRALHGRLVAAEGAVLRRGDIEMLVLGAPLVPLEDTAPLPPAEPLGRWRIQGEICDGKCAAGGMRPGTGIAHRACATLCLDGALPAVFVATRPVAGHAFLLLGDAAGGPALPAFRHLVGHRVTLEGEVTRLGDLLVFRAERP
ncbi:Rieske (2Fe-2S) protein [Falsiroseomonas tokyonensis]|uniref:Rieske 2Fe-2S domain-containing protein n=1 Tax=Falsiroseomonas tokyonensis TaxID=430521 RepID=A0ABV7BS76_9PROT|nr:Rieske (2Fe-2S) protein [Falsiroseomonas tokyonensis]MBU8538395.1 Rieske (2Fe-2S) protein [Falsiroseomonas tokyonensis]